MNNDNFASVSRYEGLFSKSLPHVVADLETYAELLTKWQKVQNLVSRETLAHLWTRHFADSLQALKLIRPSDVTFFDLGSGGGFPALPLAVASRETSRQFHLVEPTTRKVSFLRTVARELNLAVKVHSVRIEQIDSRETTGVDVVTSRALATLPALLTMAAPILGSQTRLILHKGREHVDELTAAAANWEFDVIKLASDTSDDGVLLEISNLKPLVRR